MDKLRPMNKTEKRILTVTCWGHFLSHFNVIVFPALVLPLSARLGLDLGRVLELSFWMYLLFGLSALPWGLIADRYGPRPLLMVYFSGCALSAFAAAKFIDSPTGLSLSLAGIGLFSGIYHPAGLGWIAKSIDRISLAMGYNGMFGNLGLAAAPLLTGLVNYMSGPQACYVVLGLLNLVGLVVMVMLPADSKAVRTEAAEAESRPAVAPFVILLMAMMLAGVVYRGASVTLPAILELNSPTILSPLADLFKINISPNLTATAVASVIYLIGVLGQYCGGWAADRFDSRYALMFFNMMTIPFAAMVGWAVGGWLAVAALLFFLFHLGVQPVENTLVTKFTPPKLRSSAFGFKFVLTFGIGAGAVKMAGFLERTWGLSSVYPTLAVIAALVTLTVGVLILKTKTTIPVGRI